MQLTFVFCIWLVFLSYATSDRIVIMHSKSGKCLNTGNTYQSIGVRMVLRDCVFSGQSTPYSETIAVVKADNGTVLFLMFNAFPWGAQGCIYTGMQEFDPLYIKKCDPKDNTQQWIVRKVDGTQHDEFHLVQKATGMCVSPFPEFTADTGDTMRTTPCYKPDREQMWKICNIGGICKTSF